MSGTSVADVLDGAGVGNVAGLREALEAHAPTVEALRAMSDETLEAALAPLSLRQLTLKKVRAAMSGVRSPDGQNIHRGFDFGAEDIDKVQATPRAERVAPTTPPAASSGSRDDVMAEPPSSGQAAASSVRASTMGLTLATASIGDEDVAPIFTPRTGPTRAGAQPSEPDVPIFTPRSAPRATAATGPAGPLNVAAAVSSGADDGPAPIFTPRTAAFLDGDPIFTERTLAELSVVDPVKPSLTAAAADDEPIFTPRSLLALQGATTSQTPQLSLPPPGTSFEVDEDAPIFTPRTLSRKLAQPAPAIGAEMPMDMMPPEPVLSSALAIQCADGLMFTPRAVDATGAPVEGVFELADAEVGALVAPSPVDVSDAAGEADDDEMKDIAEDDTTDGNESSPDAKGAAKPKKGASPTGKAPSARASKADAKGGAKTGAKKKAVAKKGSPKADSPAKSPPAKVPVPEPKGKGKKGAKGAKKSAPGFPFSVVIKDGDGAQVGSMQTVLAPKTASSKLSTALIEHAVAELSVQALVAQVVINDEVIDHTEPVSTFCTAGQWDPVEVTIVMAGHADATKSFAIEVFVAGKEDHSPIYRSSVRIPQPTTAGARLWTGLIGEGAWMSKPLRTALVEKALRDADLASAKVCKICVNGSSTRGDDEARLYAELEGPEIRLSITIEKTSAPMPFHVDLIQHDGKLLSTTSTVLSSTLLVKPLYAALVAPALASHNIIGASLQQLVVKVDGFETDHRRLTHAASQMFVAPGGEPTHVEVLLPRTAVTAISDAKFAVSVHHASASRDAIDLLDAELHGPQLSMSLKAAVIDPAMKEFIKRHPELKVQREHASVFIDDRHVGNRVTDSSAIASTFVKAGTTDVAVAIVLPLHAIKHIEPGFVIDIVTAEGELYNSVETKLTGVWRDRSLTKAIIKPLLEAEGLTDIGWSSVANITDIAETSPRPVRDPASTKCSALTSTLGQPSGQPTRLRLTLNVASRPIGPSSALVGDASIGAAAAAGGVSPNVFDIEMVLDGQVVSSSTTQPKLKWLRGKSILGALALPAVRHAKLGHVTIGAISVDGTVVDGDAPSVGFLKPSGADVKMSITLHFKEKHGSQVALGLKRLASVGTASGHFAADLMANAMNAGGAFSSAQAAFVVDLFSATGEHLSTAETRLKGRWLEKSLAKGLLEPALESMDAAGQQWRDVTINGVRIDETNKASFFGVIGSDDPTHVSVTLAVPGFVLPKRAAAEETPNFVVEVHDADGKVLTSSTTCLNRKWLDRPIEKLATSAVKADRKFANARVGEVYIDGQSADLTRRAREFIRMDGTAAVMSIRLADGV